MNIKPTPGYLLINPEEAKKQTASGILLAETALEKPSQGKVVKVGEDTAVVGAGGIMMASPAEVGQTVIYKKWGGDEIKWEDKDYKLVRFEDVMAVLEDDNA